MPDRLTRGGDTSRSWQFAAATACLVVTIVVAACGGSSTSPTVGGSGATDAAQGSPGASLQSPAGGSPAAPADRLTQAFATMAAAYTFDSTLTVGGKVATHATGRWVAGSSEVVVESSGISITYRSIPPSAWVLKPGSAWVVVDGTIPSGDPLDALAKPNKTTISADDGDGLHLVATYDAPDLGLTGTGTVPVTLLIAPDGSITATYTGDPASGSAVSLVILRPAPDPAPIVAPSPSAQPS